MSGGHQRGEVRRFRARGGGHRHRAQGVPNGDDAEADGDEDDWWHWNDGLQEEPAGLEEPADWWCDENSYFATNDAASSTSPGQSGDQAATANSAAQGHLEATGPDDNVRCSTELSRPCCQSYEPNAKRLDKLWNYALGGADIWMPGTRTTRCSTTSFGSSTSWRTTSPGGLPLQAGGMPSAFGAHYGVPCGAPAFYGLGMPGCLGCGAPHLHPGTMPVLHPGLSNKLP